MTAISWSFSVLTSSERHRSTSDYVCFGLFDDRPSFRVIESFSEYFCHLFFACFLYNNHSYRSAVLSNFNIAATPHRLQGAGPGLPQFNFFPRKLWPLFVSLVLSRFWGAPGWYIYVLTVLWWGMIGPQKPGEKGRGVEKAPNVHDLGKLRQGTRACWCVCVFVIVSGFVWKVSFEKSMNKGVAILSKRAWHHFPISELFLLPQTWYCLFRQYAAREAHQSLDQRRSFLLLAKLSPINPFFLKTFGELQDLKYTCIELLHAYNNAQVFFLLTPRGRQFILFDLF